MTARSDADGKRGAAPLGRLLEAGPADVEAL
ncbi:hypothetical protein HYSC106933_05365 [Hydrogenibacillus schlegelii]